MNRNMIRGALYGAGFGLPVWAFLAAFFSVTAFVVLLIGGMVCLIAAVLIEDDDGYDQTVQGVEHTEFQRWERQMGADK